MLEEQPPTLDPSENAATRILKPETMEHIDRDPRAKRVEGVPPRSTEQNVRAPRPSLRPTVDRLLGRPSRVQRLSKPNDECERLLPVDRRPFEARFEILEASLSKRSTGIELVYVFDPTHRHVELQRPPEPNLGIQLCCHAVEFARDPVIQKKGAFPSKECRPGANIKPAGRTRPTAGVSGRSPTARACNDNAELYEPAQGDRPCHRRRV